MRVLFMLEKNKQNEEMNKTVLFKIREGGIEKKGGVLFILGMRYQLRSSGARLGRMPHNRINVM